MSYNIYNIYDIYYIWIYVFLFFQNSQNNLGHQQNLFFHPNYYIPMDT